MKRVVPPENAAERSGNKVKYFAVICIFQTNFRFYKYFEISKCFSARITNFTGHKAHIAKHVL